jgi:hypothetical protein
VDQFKQLYNLDDDVDGLNLREEVQQRRLVVRKLA